MKHLSILKLVALSFIVVLGCGSNNKETSNAPDGAGANNDFLATEASTALSQIPFDTKLVFSKEELQNKGYVLKGSVQNFKGAVYLHELTPSKLSFMDSISTDENGQFQFEGSFAEPTLCFLTFGSANPPGIPVILGSNKLGLTISFGDIINFSTNGDKDNELLKDLYNIYAGHDLAMYRFNNEVQKLDPNVVSDSMRAAVQNKFDQLSTARSNDIANFIKQKPGSPATYFAVTFLVEEPAASILETALEKMKSAVPASKYTKEISIRLEMLSPLDIGGLAPDIELSDPDGKIIKLSSLRGKVVLIDFWASWCRPCRVENPNVKRVYEKYKSKGFEIYGVSLDNSKDKWVAAIAADGLPWKHVSDLKGWQSSAAQRYQVNSIPYTVLLDKNGRILAKGLRSEALDQKLAQILN